MATRWFALMIGIVYVLVGVAGFIPALGSDRATPHLDVDSHYRDLFDLFPVNVIHNIVHLVIGAAGIFAYGTYGAARGFCRGLAILYALLAVMGMIPALETTFDLIPLFSHDIWLHALTSFAAGYFGWAVGEDDTGEPIHADRRGTVQ
jgi:hypothetical protein